MGSIRLSNKISELSKLELLQRANDFIFSTGLNDGASKLCRANMKYGLAQFQLIQERYGFEPKATFISSPDETISRNNFRWNSGLGYGGRLNWGSGNDKIVFLNIKPNCCGILAGGLDELPDAYEIIKKIDSVKSTELYSGDILLNWDYGISNHFINCYETKNLSDIELPPFIFMIHGSAPEFRDDRYGLGLYIDSSKSLIDRAIKEPTEFGNQFLLLDSDAKEYLEFNKKAINFSNVKREIIAMNLFSSDYKVICNTPHQFLKDYNNMYLGSNCTDDNSTNVFPTTLRADLAGYLFRGRKSFSKTTLKNNGFLERAENFELLDLLMNANLLPHGGGYLLPDISRVQKVLEYKYQRYFACELIKDISKLKIVRNVKDLQFEYRGRDVILKTLQLELGEVIARLNPIFSLKL
ncbi:MAG: hypothetical protein HWN80_17070 [Candidatus Lokiarchaeota archaeon]|nr:hypothetical protein [Candidatus Lokiarchaeota archaeon]